MVNYNNIKYWGTALTVAAIAAYLSHGIYRNERIKKLEQVNVSQSISQPKSIAEIPGKDYPNLKPKEKIKQKEKQKEIKKKVKCNKPKIIYHYPQNPIDYSQSTRVSQTKLASDERKILPAQEGDAQQNTPSYSQTSQHKKNTPVLTVLDRIKVNDGNVFINDIEYKIITEGNFCYIYNQEYNFKYKLKGKKLVTNLPCLESIINAVNDINHVHKSHLPLIFVPAK